MTNGRRHLLEDLRGASRLIVDATTGITDLVEEMHHTVASGPPGLGSPLAAPARLLLAPIYGSIRGITRLVGAGVDGVLSESARLIEDAPPGVEREILLAALNGVIGDHLFASKNPLAIRATLRRHGVPLVLEREALASGVSGASRRVVVFVHGSCMTCHQWRRREHDHSEALERDVGVTSLHAVYNSGLHVSTNGRTLAALLEELFAAWPVPLDEISLVGHSMGGLVARSAAHYANEDGLAFRQSLRRLVCLGSPHHGALLERTGNWLGVLLGVSRYSAPFERLARIRSAGVTDLRYGNVLDEDWAVHDRFASRGDRRKHVPLPTDVDSFLVAGSLTAAPGGGAPLGDGLVTVASALGRHEEPERTLSLPEARQLVVYGHGHLDLLDSGVVYGALRGWFSG